MTSRASASRVVGVDGLRALAALAVFVCHINGYWGFLNLPGKLPQLMELGAHGVDLFVVISGFCLAMPLVVRANLGLELRPFLGRRATRILPPYAVALGIAAALAILPTWHFVVAQRATWPDLLVHLLVMQTWFPGLVGTINGSLWSVSLEVQLYLVFPLLVLLWRRFGFAWVLFGATVMSISWELLGRWPGMHGLFGGAAGSTSVLPDRLVQFSAGAACAALWAAARIPRVRVLVTGVVIGGLVAGVASTTGLEIGVSALWAIPSAAAVLLIIGRPGDALARSPLDGFGAISYSFYLLHQPVILLMAVAVAFIPGGWPVQLVVGGALCLTVAWAAGWLLYRLVERPSHELGRRRFGRVVRRPKNDAERLDPTPPSTSDE